MKKYLKRIALIIAGVAACSLLFFDDDSNKNVTPTSKQTKDEILNKAINLNKYPESKKAEKRNGEIILKQ